MRVMLVVLLLIQMMDAETLYYYKDHKRVMLAPLPHTTKIGSMNRKIEQIRYFRNPHGHTVGVMSEVVVKLNPNTSIEMIQSRYGAQVKKRLSKDIYVLKAATPKEAIKLANRLYENEEVRYAHPNMVRKVQKR